MRCTIGCPLACFKSLKVNDRHGFPMAIITMLSVIFGFCLGTDFSSCKWTKKNYIKKKGEFESIIGVHLCKRNYTKKV